MPKLFAHSRQGTFTAEARVRVAAALTDLGIACEHLSVPVYVVIREVPEIDWGMYGKQVSLAALRAGG